jgi:hypothetical protein
LLSFLHYARFYPKYISPDSLISALPALGSFSYAGAWYRIGYRSIRFVCIARTEKNGAGIIRIQPQQGLLILRVQDGAAIEERISVIVPNFAALLHLTEEISVTSIFRGQMGNEQRNRGADFRYFAIGSGNWGNNIRQFRYW